MESFYNLYGKPGDPIPNSEYVRAYCSKCGEPIRVSCARFSKDDVRRCEDCGGGGRDIPFRDLHSNRCRVWNGTPKSNAKD